MIKNVIFDLGNVLFTFNRKQLLANYVEDDGRLEKIIFNEWLMRDEGTVSDEDFLAHLKPKLNQKEYGVAKSLVETWIDKLVYDDDMYEFIKWLKGQGINVFALSNIPVDFAKKYREIKQMQVFSDCVFSSEEKLLKPDKRIFIRAIERFKVNPADTLYIDDSVENVEVAMQCGMKGFTYSKNLKQLKEFFMENK